MADFTESVLLPALLAGPLLVVCTWLLWAALGRPCAGVRRPTKLDVRAAVPCLVVLAATGGFCVAFNVAVDAFNDADHRNQHRFAAMHGVYSALARYQADHGRPPAGQADIEAYEEPFSSGIAAIHTGEVVVLWGRPTSESSDPRWPVAHERLDSHRRIYVVWSDGRVTQEDPSVVQEFEGPK
jgi:hypothetical protein